MISSQSSGSSPSSHVVCCAEAEPSAALTSSAKDGRMASLIRKLRTQESSREGLTRTHRGGSATTPSLPPFLSLSIADYPAFRLRNNSHSPTQRCI